MAVTAGTHRRLDRMVRAVSNQARHVGMFLAPLSPTDFERATILPHWDVRTLTAHLVVNQAQLFETLECPTEARPVALHSYLRGLRTQRHRTSQLAREVADNESGPHLLTQLSHSVAELVLWVANETIPQVVAAAHDSLSTADYLRSVVIEWVVHSDDLSRSLPERAPVTMDPTALADAVRTLVDAMSKRFPGRSIEIRVPPYAAAQCGTRAGELGTGEIAASEPSHTRGTPPTVVETDPLTFLRLSTGRTQFRAELSQGRVQASGARSDLTAMLPLLS